MAWEIMARPPMSHSTRAPSLVAKQAVASSLQVQIEPNSPKEAADMMAATAAIPRGMMALFVLLTQMVDQSPGP